MQSCGVLLMAKDAPKVPLATAHVVPRSWWERKRTYGLALLVGLIGWYVWPLFDHYSEQDDCTFGSVTNAEYREMLKEVREMVRNGWEPLKVAPGFMSREERKRLSEIFRLSVKKYTDRYTGVDRKFAAIHAVMRGAFKASFRYQSFAGMASDPRRTQSVKYFTYRRNIDSSCWFRCMFPSERWALFSLRMTKTEFLPIRSDSGRALSHSGGAWFTYSVINGFRLGPASGETCPAPKMAFNWK